MEKVSTTILQKLAKMLNFRHKNNFITFKQLSTTEFNTSVPMIEI